MAPEYLVGQLTNKADVYSFRVLVVQIVCGRRNCAFTQDSCSLLQRTSISLLRLLKMDSWDGLINGKYSTKLSILIQLLTWVVEIVWHKWYIHFDLHRFGSSTNQISWLKQLTLIWKVTFQQKCDQCASNWASLHSGFSFFKTIYGWSGFFKTS